MHEDMLRPPPPRRTRATERAREILARQLEDGRETLKLPWARDAEKQIREVCPSLADDDVARLFHDRSSASPETVLQAALFLEWNRTHGGAPPAPTRSPPKRRK